MIGETWRTKEIFEEFLQKGYWSDETLTDCLDRNSNLYPDKWSVIDSKSRITFRELAQKADRLAIRLEGIGVKKGDRILMLLPDWSEVFCMRYALGRIGAICCIGAIDWRRREIEHAFSLTQSVAVAIPKIFKGFDFLTIIRDISGKHEALKHILLLDDAPQDGCVSLRAMIEEDLERAYPDDFLKQFRASAQDIDKIQFTAGTTGLAKAVMRFPSNHIAIGKAVVERLRITEKDKVFSVAPISGGLGIVSAVYATALSGATAILLDKFDEKAALRIIEKERATIVAAVPTQTIKMLDVPSLDQYDLSSLRCWITAGAPLPLKTWYDVSKKFGCPIASFYGSVDTGLAAVSGVDDPLEKIIGSGGRIIPRTEVKIVDEEGHPLPLGQEGEILVRGGTVMAGYFGDPVATRERIDSDGWGRTGDYGFLDTENIIRIVGRKKELIIRGGQNISPKELEDLIMTHPKVLEVAVVGIPDPILGEKACACIIPKPGQTISFEELSGFLRSKEIEIHKLPERLELMKHFPLSEGRKVQKYRLKEMIVEKMKKEI
jgi:non-ribosomal peptide synthetase component E (peptide arylation enzyme)